MQTNLGATVHEPCPVWAGSYRQSTERSRGRERERRRIRVWWPRSGHFENHCCSSAEGPEPCGHRGPQETDGQETSGLLKGECLQKTSWVTCTTFGATVTLFWGWQINTPSSSWFRPSTLQRSRGTSVDRGACDTGIHWGWGGTEETRHHSSTSIALFHTHTHDLNICLVSFKKKKKSNRVKQAAVDQRIPMSRTISVNVF